MTTLNRIDTTSRWQTASDGSVWCLRVRDDSWELTGYPDGGLDTDAFLIAIVSTPMVLADALRWENAMIAAFVAWRKGVQA